MIYQLPTGKIIHLTLEEFLDLTDQDVQYLISVNAGYHAPVRNPFIGSPIEQKPVKEREEDQEDEEEEEIEDETPPEDFPEIPEAPPDLGIDLD